jgi:hypothetical protein
MLTATEALKVPDFHASIQQKPLGVGELQNKSLTVDQIVGSAKLWAGMGVYSQYCLGRHFAEIRDRMVREKQNWVRWVDSHQEQIGWSRAHVYKWIAVQEALDSCGFFDGLSAEASLDKASKMKLQAGALYALSRSGIPHEARANVIQRIMIRSEAGVPLKQEEVETMIALEVNPEPRAPYISPRSFSLSELQELVAPHWRATHEEGTAYADCVRLQCLISSHVFAQDRICPSPSLARDWWEYAGRAKTERVLTWNKFPVSSRVSVGDRVGTVIELGDRARILIDGEMVPEWVDFEKLSLDTIAGDLGFMPVSHMPAVVDTGHGEAVMTVTAISPNGWAEVAEGHRYQLNKVSWVGIDEEEAEESEVPAPAVLEAAIAALRSGDKAGAAKALRGVAKELQHGHSAGVLDSSGNDEQHTPKRLWEPGLEVFGVESFELDPASYAGSQIPCDRIFTKEQNALLQDWECGCLWFNFPFSEQKAFTRKFLEQYAAGKIDGAIGLSKMDNRTEWWSELAEACSAMCLVTGYDQFESPSADGNSNKNSSFFPIVIWYFGPDVDKFCYAYSSVGIVVQELNPAMFGA